MTPSPSAFAMTLCGETTYCMPPLTMRSFAFGTMNATFFRAHAAGARLTLEARSPPACRATTLRGRRRRPARTRSPAPFVNFVRGGTGCPMRRALRPRLARARHVDVEPGVKHANSEKLGRREEHLLQGRRGVILVVAHGLLDAATDTLALDALRRSSVDPAAGVESLRAVRDRQRAHCAPSHHTSEGTRRPRWSRVRWRSHKEFLPRRPSDNCALDLEHVRRGDGRCVPEADARNELDGLFVQLFEGVDVGARKVGSLGHGETKEEHASGRAAVGAQLPTFIDMSTDVSPPFDVRKLACRLVMTFHGLGTAVLLFGEHTFKLSKGWNSN